MKTMFMSVGPRSSRWSISGVALAIALGSVRCGDGSAASCDALGSRAHDERTAIHDEANRSCTADNDCAAVGIALSCYADCGVRSAIARSSAASVDAALQQVENVRCGEFAEQGCARPPLLPCYPGALEG